MQCLIAVSYTHLDVYKRQAWISPEKKQVLKVKKEKSLSQIKAPATEAKPLKSHLVVKADTDTTKMKKNNIYFTTNQNGKRITYTSLDAMPDSCLLYTSRCV